LGNWGGSLFFSWNYFLLSKDIVWSTQGSWSSVPIPLVGQEDNKPNPRDNFHVEDLKAADSVDVVPSRSTMVGQVVLELVLWIQKELGGGLTGGGI
jgi:hypothetical protein